MNVGFVGWGGPPQGGPARYTSASGWTMLLPFIEQGNLYAEYDYNQAASWSYGYGAYAPSDVQGDPDVNYPVVKTKITAFVCPTDSSNDYFYNSTNQYYSVSATNVGGTRTNYDFNNWYGEYYY